MAESSVLRRTVLPNTSFSSHSLGELSNGVSSSTPLIRPRQVVVVVGEEAEEEEKTQPVKKKSRKSEPKNLSKKANESLAHLRDNMNYIYQRVISRVWRFVPQKSPILSGLVAEEQVEKTSTFSKSLQAQWQVQPCRYSNEYGHSTCQQMAARFAHLCDVHAKEVYGLEIKMSTVPNSGEGLFACKAFEKGALIDLYVGEILLPFEFKARYEDVKSEYGFATEMTVGSTIIPLTVDARGTQTCVGRYINEPEHPSQLNVAFVLAPSSFFLSSSHSSPTAVQSDPTMVTIRAMHNIKAGEELFVYYGSKFH